MFEATIYCYNEDSWSQGDYIEILNVLAETKELGYEFIHKFFDENKNNQKIYLSGYGNFYGELKTYKPIILKNFSDINLLFTKDNSIEENMFYEIVLLPGATK